MKKVKFKQTGARKMFKKYFGEANHFLITTFIALDYLDDIQLNEISDEYGKTWNPNNKEKLKLETKQFIIEGFLGKSVDALDRYIRDLDKKPNLFYFEKEKINTLLTTHGDSVRKRYEGLSEIFSIDSILVALLDLLITWRNNVIHSSSNLGIFTNSKKVLLDNKIKIEERYPGFKINLDLFNRVKNTNELSFQETITFIKVVHEFVQELDEKIINQLNISDICYNLVIEEIKNSSHFRHKYFGFKGERKEEYVLGFLGDKLNMSVREDYYKIIDCFGIKKELGN